MDKNSKILFLILTVCFWALQCQGPPLKPDHLRTITELKPQSLNPYFVSDGHTQALLSYVYESFLGYDLKIDAYKPALAESWEVLEDKKNYLFHLRPGVVWQDGQPLTAEDVLASFAFITEQKVNLNYQNVALQIKNIRVVNPLLIQIEVKEAHYASLYALGSLPIIPKRFIDAYKGREPSLFLEEGVGTGPYQFEETKSKERLLLKRNDLYWGNKPGFKYLEISYVMDTHLAFQKLKKGELDFIDGLTDLQAYKQSQSEKFKSQFELDSFLASNYSAILWNHKNPLFQDAKVRVALTHLLNREMILEKLKFGSGVLATGPFVNRSARSHPDVKPLEFNPEKALQLLAEAGFSDTNGDKILEKDGLPFKFNLLVSSAPALLSYATIFQQDLKHAGIDMQLKVLDHKQLINNVLQREFDASFFKWGIGFESDIYNFWHSSVADVVGSYNVVSYKNSEVDKWLEAAQVEFDPVKRNLIYQKIHEKLAQDQPYTFLFVDRYLMAYSKRLKNVQMYLLGYDLLEWHE